MPRTQETNPDVKASSAAGGAVGRDYISIFIDSSREMKKESEFSKTNLLNI